MKSNLRCRLYDLIDFKQFNFEKKYVLFLCCNIFFSIISFQANDDQDNNASKIYADEKKSWIDYYTHDPEGKKEAQKYAIAASLIISAAVAYLVYKKLNPKQDIENNKSVNQKNDNAQQVTGASKKSEPLEDTQDKRNEKINEYLNYINKQADVLKNDRVKTKEMLPSFPSLNKFLQSTSGEQDVAQNFSKQFLGADPIQFSNKDSMPSHLRNLVEIIADPKNIFTSEIRSKAADILENNVNFLDINGTNELHVILKPSDINNIDYPQSIKDRQKNKEIYIKSNMGVTERAGGIKDSMNKKYISPNSVALIRNDPTMYEDLKQMYRKRGFGHEIDNGKMFLNK